MKPDQPISNKTQLNIYSRLAVIFNIASLNWLAWFISDKENKAGFLVKSAVLSLVNYWKADPPSDMVSVFNEQVTHHYFPMIDGTIEDIEYYHRIDPSSPYKPVIDHLKATKSAFVYLVSSNENPSSKEARLSLELWRTIALVCWEGFKIEMLGDSGVMRLMPYTTHRRMADLLIESSQRLNNQLTLGNLLSELLNLTVFLEKNDLKDVFIIKLEGFAETLDILKDLNLN